MVTAGPESVPFVTDVAGVAAASVSAVAEAARV